jgi:asparagine synthase (glutamine-hydrolysing)
MATSLRGSVTDGSRLDPSPAGAQPMSYGDRWWITYNGELYNFPQLRRELELRDERFETECDAQVLLRMFAVHGPTMLERLNGIFTFAIWDDRDRRLFVARDRLGVKPLYSRAARAGSRVRVGAEGAAAADWTVGARTDGARGFPHLSLDSRP